MPDHVPLGHEFGLAGENPDELSEIQ